MSNITIHYPWNKGLTKKIDERVKKISLKLKGRHITPQTEFKKGHPCLLKKHTKETIKKLSEMRKGIKNPMFGKHSWCYKTKGLLKPNKTSFKKGNHYSINTEFKKGEHIGENNPSWKGGVTKLVNKIRNSDEYNKWRKKIFSRDKYKCVLCDSKTYINAHHKKEFSILIKNNKINSFEEALKCKELWYINNGVTLCLKCHSKFHPKVKLFKNPSGVYKNE